MNTAKKLIYLGGLSVTALFLLGGCAKPAKVTIPPVPKIKPGLTLAVVAQHNDKSDCWLVINNNIYRLTDYLYTATDGGSQIVGLCGKDATKDFTGKDENGQPKLGVTEDQLEQFYIGSISR